MQTLQMVKDLVKLISYKDWELRVSEIDDSHWFIQWTFMAPDAETGDIQKQFCRKWLISQHMLDSEIVSTAFKAALSAEEHECRE